MILEVFPSAVSSRTARPGLDVILVETGAVDDVVSTLNGLLGGERTLREITIHHEVFNLLKNDVNRRGWVIGHFDDVFFERTELGRGNFSISRKQVIENVKKIPVELSGYTRFEREEVRLFNCGHNLLSKGFLYPTNFMEKT